MSIKEVFDDSEIDDFASDVIKDKLGYYPTTLTGHDSKTYSLSTLVNEDVADELLDKIVKKGILLYGMTIISLC